MKILVVTEQRQGKWNNTSFETLVAAQQIAAATSGTITAAVVGKGVAALAEELATKNVAEVLAVENDLLENYTPDGYCTALKQVVESAKPDLVLFPHTYQVRDFAPKLGGYVGQRNGRRLHRLPEGRRETGVCPANVPGKNGGGRKFCGRERRGSLRSSPEHFARICWRRIAGGKAPVNAAKVELKAEDIRTKPLELFKEAKASVDLTQAPLIVAIGRGIKAPENIAQAEAVAKALGGEIAASRPICDEGWLPMERQIGSSGQTVAPKLYLALGISGAIQHVVGMKGSRTIVAVNKDQNAPIFEIADYGIVGDIFEIMPALTEELQKAKG